MSIDVGQTAVFEQRFSQRDFDRFATLSGDDNPIHVDPEFSARSRFGRTVAHGMLLYAAISRGLGMLLPQPGCLQLEQTLVFRHPTHTETPVRVELEVMRSEPQSGTADVQAVVRLPDGAPACEGRTTVRLPAAFGAFQPGRRPVDAPPVSEAAVLGHLAVGQRATTRRIFTREDLGEYADLTGDANPLYTDPVFARRAGFAGCLVPGPLISGLFSCLLGTQLPGRGTNWLKQHLVYPAAAIVGRELRATVEVVRLRAEKLLVNLRGTCITADGEAVCHAQSLVLVRDVAGMPQPQDG